MIDFHLFYNFLWWASQWHIGLSNSFNVGFKDFLFQIIDEKGNILPPNTEGYLGIRIKPTRPLGLFVEYEVMASHPSYLKNV